MKKRKNNSRHFFASLSSLSLTSGWLVAARRPPSIGTPPDWLRAPRSAPSSSDS